MIFNPVLIRQIFFGFAMLLPVPAIAQPQNDDIKTREGFSMSSRREMVNTCLSSLHKSRADTTALKICNCYADKIDGHFTNKQFKRSMLGNHFSIQKLISSDTVYRQQFDSCFINSGKTILIEAEASRDYFIDKCKKSIIKNASRKPDETRLYSFCYCQYNIIKTKQLTDADIATLYNPNSLLSYEIMYTCGDPFAEKETTGRNWNDSLTRDVSGPANDTVAVLNMNGLTYLKMKTGSLVQFWLFDTGSADLLISKEIEAQLRQEGTLKKENYTGTGEYELEIGRAHV